MWSLSGDHGSIDSGEVMNRYECSHMSAKREDEDMDKRYWTADGYPITDGCVLWNYYDLYRVTVRMSGPHDHANPENEFHQYWDGWFTCDREAGGSVLLNGERLSMFHPFTRERAVPEPVESECNCSNPYCQV